MWVDGVFKDCLPSGLFVPVLEAPSSEPALLGDARFCPWDKPKPNCSAISAWSWWWM